MKYKSYKQVTLKADVEYGEKVNLQGFIDLIDWKKAIIFGVCFDDESFMEIHDESFASDAGELLHVIRIPNPPKLSTWDKICGKTDPSIIYVKPELLNDTITKYWPEQDK